MKLQDDITDVELEMFFSELRNKDSHLNTPTYPGKPTFKIWKLLPIGIAASLLLGLWIWNQEKDDITLYQDMIIISLIERENQEQTIIIEQAASMDVWESPTASLLNEF
ncbi:hypothetical protein ACFSKL_05600 [Belliella marina]|uniref:Uncharacterized protein n=1 Tax=Belliella marina TaxID=1644146 RepID=A0ABW4VKN6_9BACT